MIENIFTFPSQLPFRRGRLVRRRAVTRAALRKSTLRMANTSPSFFTARCQCLTWVWHCW